MNASDAKVISLEADAGNMAKVYDIINRQALLGLREAVVPDLNLKQRQLLKILGYQLNGYIIFW